MHFSLTDWSLLVLASAIAFALSDAAKLVVSGFFDARMTIQILIHAPLVLAAISLVLSLPYPLASWLILRHRVDGLRLTRWLLASAFGFALGLTPLWLLAWFPRPLSTVHLVAPGGLSAVQVLFVWIATVAACVAYYLPPGILLQRLSGTNAWPFILGGAASTLANMLIGLTGRPSAEAAGFVSGAIHGLGAGAGLFLMARRSARSR